MTKYQLVASTMARTPASTMANTPSRTMARTPASTMARTPASTMANTPSRTMARTPASTMARTPASTMARTPASTMARTPSRTMASTPASTMAYILLSLLLLSCAVAMTEALPAAGDTKQPATEEAEEKEFTIKENATEIVSVHLPDSIDINTTIIIEYEIGDAEEEIEDKSSLCEGKADILKCWMEMESSGDDRDEDTKAEDAYISSGNIHFSVGYAENHLKDFNVFVKGSKVGSICLETLTTAFVDMDIKDSNETSLQLLITSHVDATKTVKIGNIYNSDDPCTSTVIVNNGTYDFEEKNGFNILVNNVELSSNNVTDDIEENDLNIILNNIEVPRNISLDKNGGEKNPKLILNSTDDFVDKITEKNNSLVCSTDSGATCHFPFIWQGLKHHGCIPGGGDQHLGQDKHWCSTKVDDDGVHVEGHSSTCKLHCPLDTVGYFFGQTGLTQVKALVKKWGGTDDEVRIQLSHGWKGARCTTGWLNQRQGWDVDNWSNGDTEVYTQNLGDCQEFKSNGTAFGFKMIVSNQGAGLGRIRFWNDELCLDKMEFIVQATKYTWEPTKGEEDNCWENFQGPVKIATRSNL